jgi:hypothetical protein
MKTEERFMVTLERNHDGHTRRVVITRGVVGWDVREERDSRVVRQITYRDWHRVERVMQAFELEQAAYSTNR